MNSIIYVDDDPDDIELFKEAIFTIDQGITLHTFEKCKDVESFLQSSTAPVSHIFIDVNMPRMDGYQCARVLRNISSAGIILVSTTFNPVRQKNFSLSDVRYMNKSASLNETVDVLKRLLMNS